MKVIPILVISGMFGLLAAVPAHAMSPADVLKKLDEAEYAAKDTIAEVKMILEEESGKTSERKMKMYQKGSEKRLIRFESPADVKGIAFLDADGKMYVYMPAFHKIRRIAGHVKNENFAGTDFAHDDLSSVSFSERLEPIGLKEEGEHYLLEVREKTEDSKYSRLVFQVRKKDFLFSRVEYYDKAGEKWKVFERKEFKPAGKYVQSFWAEMSDLKNKHKTRMIVESVKCDTGIKDSKFSKRQLKRH
jgi:outer membrane lipoprotein-sorting protein